MRLLKSFLKVSPKIYIELINLCKPGWIDVNERQCNFPAFWKVHWITNKIQLFTLFEIVWNIFKVNIGDEVGVRFWISWMVLFTESFLSFFLWQNVVGIHSNGQTFHVPWSKICLFIKFIKKLSVIVLSDEKQLSIFATF